MNTSETNPVQVLLVNPGQALPIDTDEYLASQGYQVEVSRGYSGALARAQASSFNAVVMPTPSTQDAGAVQPFQNLLRAIELQGTAAIILGEGGCESQAEASQLIDFASAQVTKEEIQGRLAILLRYHDVVRAMERDLDNMQRLFKQLNIHFTQVDQEMRLAGRLQTAFLPRHVESLASVSFATLYRPATFVSGDIYDIFRVDEEHVAFYIADAVGHGMAASLLTMFIKTAMVSKKVHDDYYELLEPNETLQLLNQRLIDQQLPNSQFVTACYALFNTRTLELHYARAGHPYPLRCTRQGQLSELKSPGGLLGLFEGEDFPAQKVTMKPGEKLILYSDGLELAFAEAQDRLDEMNYYRQVLQEMAHLPADRLVREFARLLDGEAGSLNPRDDVTMLVVQVNEPTA